MPATIKRYDGTELVTLADYQYNDTASTLVLNGFGVTNYTQAVAENFIHLLENFAGPTPPGLPARLGTPITGQLWYDTGTRKLRVRSSTSNWDVVGSANVGTIPPNPPNAGDFWLDTTTEPARLRVWTGVVWQLVGAAASASSRESTASSGNATSATDNYFTSTTLGENAEPMIGDLWYDVAVGRLKVYNGTFWQFVGSPVTGFTDTGIAGNTTLIPTTDTTLVTAVGSGSYHTSSSLGPSMGVFAVGDLKWDNVRNQLFVVTEGADMLVGPTSPYRLDAGGAIRGYTSHLHFTGGTSASPTNDDMMGVFTDGGLKAVWSGGDVLVGDLPTSLTYQYGPETKTIDVQNAFSLTSQTTSSYVKSGLNLLDNLTVQNGRMGVGGLDTSAMFTLMAEDTRQGSEGMKVIRYSNDALESNSIVFERSRGSLQNVSEITSGDRLGRVTFSGMVSGVMAEAASMTVQYGTGGLVGSVINGEMVFSTAGAERLRISNAVRASVNYEAIPGTGNGAGQTSATEFPSITFTGNTGTGMSSPTGQTLNLALRGQLILQGVNGGTHLLLGNWRTTGNHTVDGDVTADEGFFNNITTTTITAGGQQINASDFMRRDGGVGADTSRIPTIGANADGTGGLDFGTASQRWGIFYGVAFRTGYGDVAERYASDEPLSAGTVVMLAGEKEITKTTTHASPDVFGVISSKPALFMNDSAGTDESHPFVAFSGRLPCWVVGPVKKGQRLVSSHVPGMAEGCENDPSLIFSIIGRSLVDKTTQEPELIEIVVGKL